MTPAIRMARQREARKAKGLTEVRVWLRDGDVARLDLLVAGSGRTKAEVMRLALMDLGGKGTDYIKDAWSAADAVGGA